MTTLDESIGELRPYLQLSRQHKPYALRGCNRYLICDDVKPFLGGR